jgi:hypothetical protein
MNTTLSFHLINSSSLSSGEILILGQNILLPVQAGLAPQYAAVIYAASAWVANAPAAGLVIKTAFSRPMVPDIKPGNMVWEQVVAPHLQNLIEMVVFQSMNPRGPRLGGVSQQVNNLIKRQTVALRGGGALLLPYPDLTSPTAGSFYRPRTIPVLKLIDARTKVEAVPPSLRGLQSQPRFCAA